MVSELTQVSICKLEPTVPFPSLACLTKKLQVAILFLLLEYKSGHYSLY